MRLYHQHTVGRVLAVIAITATVLLPGGLWVNCVTANGHAMIELAHAQHTEHPNGFDHNTPHEDHLVDSGCVDSRVDGITDAVLRDRQDHERLVTDELTGPLLLVSGEIGAQKASKPLRHDALPASGTSYPLALCGIVLLV